jgi:pimeloyl-ACP methyl ester carboxylesterase
MPLFARSSDGLSIAYDDIGSGEPVVLVHGFASGRLQNWRDPGWYDVLLQAGYRVIALDCRGHGESDKPYDPALYGHDVMAQDVAAVMREAGVETARLMGYSMGGFISIQILMHNPELIEKLVIGGVGESYLDDQPNSRDRMSDPAVRNGIADALLAPDKSTITNPTAKAFRAFAEQQGKDLRALAACIRGVRPNIPKADLSRSTRPVLVVCGEKDDLTGAPGPLAAAFADGRAATVPRRDHMTAVGDKVYKDAALEFLAG